MQKDLFKIYNDLLLKDVSEDNLRNSLFLMKKICSNEIDFNKRNKEYYDLFIPFFPEIDKNLNTIKDWTHNGKLKQNNKSISLAKNEPFDNIIFELFIALNLLPDFIYSNPKTVNENGYSFIMDVTQLIFHQSFFSLLDKLGSFEESKKSLLNIYLNYTKYINTLSDVYYIKSLCYDIMGERQRSKDYAYNAVLSSHSDDHEFMTLVQNYWANLLEDNAFEEAIEFLINIRNKILPLDMEEYNNFILLTIKIQKQKLSLLNR